MGTMYDSETPSAIPADAEIVAGYVDGQWPDFDELVTTHPAAKHVSITVLGTPGAMVGDCESGNMSPASLATWAKGEVEAGRRPTLYYSKSIAGEVGAALAAAGVDPHAVDYWPADWTGEPHILPGAVATQYASPGTGSGGNFDLSETIDGWPAVAAPAPTPEPAPPAPTGGFMPPTIKQGTVFDAVKSAQALLNLHLPPQAALVVDGYFGPKTDAVTRNFQTMFGLAVDGIIGPNTWTALCTHG